jgi:hypothetical protein
MALDAVPSSVTFNCYTTLVEADAYHEARLYNEAWTTADTARKSSALMWATRMFDTLEWKGWRTVVTQKHQFPRNMLSITGADYTVGMEGIYSTMIFDITSIPQFLKDATAELALQLMTTDLTAHTGTEGMSRIKVDTIEIAVDKSDRIKWSNGPVAPLVRRYLRQSNPYVSQTVRK